MTIDVLIAKALEGDQEAMTSLYRMTYGRVYNTVRFLVRDEDAALDIIQDSYLKAFRSLGQLEEPASFGAWIERIAHNRAVDYLRKARPVMMSSLTMEESGEEIELPDDRSENLPEISLDRKETARLLGEILDSLPQDQLACITLFYYEQLSVKEIALELGIPEATVKSRLLYGRKKIETKVRELENKGTKLYGLTPLAFLLLLFRSQKALAAEVSAASALPGEAEILQNVLRDTSAGSGEAALRGAGAKSGEAALRGAAAKSGGIAIRYAVAILAGVLVLAGEAALLSHFRSPAFSSPQP